MINIARKDFAPKSTTCGRWVKFLCSRDPLFQADIDKLLKIFAYKEGFASVALLEKQFEQEELAYKPQVNKVLISSSDVVPDSGSIPLLKNPIRSIRKDTLSPPKTTNSK